MPSKEPAQEFLWYVFQNLFSGIYLYVYTWSKYIPEIGLLDHVAKTYLISFLDIFNE